VPDDRPQAPRAIRALAPASAALAAALLVATLVAWSAGGGSVDLPWAPALDLRLHFRLDGLATLYILLASGVGVAIFAYSARYLPLHLGHSDRSQSEAVRFYALLVGFMGTMVGLATAQDLILLFVFWDLTAIASYFLIAYDRHEAESRWAALMALLVTGVSAVLLLIATLLLYAEYGTFSLPEIVERIEAGPTTTLAGVLIALAAIAKSAQVPFHFWLPRAMTAPTPVSAYLHSAAMVAAGVLLIGRTYPVLESSRLVLDGLVVVGALSMLVGGLLALSRDEIKRLLACSTFSQYGYVVFLYGLGGAKAATAAAFYVLAHALAKSALFLTAGTVTEASGGRKRLSELGGLGRAMPAVAIASGVASAAVAALPLTLGFFADELFFGAAVERGAGYVVIAVAGAALSFAYLGRFWLVLFTGAPKCEVERVPAAMVWPIVALGAVVLAGGLFPGPAAALAAETGSVSVLGPAEASPAYHLDLRAENLMALAAWGLGSLLLVGSGALHAPLLAFARLGARAGPEHIYGVTVNALVRLSDAVHELEVRDLRTRVAAVLMPAGLLVAIGVLATPTADAYAVGEIRVRDYGLVLALLVACAGALASTLPRRHLTLALVVATVGYGLTAVYAFIGAPDVALVAVLVETVLAVLLLGVFSLVPADVLRREAELSTRSSRRWRDMIVGTVSGGIAFLLAWGALSRPVQGEGVAGEQVRLAGEAHAKDVVTAILADFRGLDTLVEVTVVAVALLGVSSLLRRGRLR
jgi:multicomponent Na+:H+ antiporter subunit A